MSDFVAGNDATFAVLMFVLITCLNFAIWLFSGVKFAYLLWRSPEFRKYQQDSWKRWLDQIKYLWSNPGVAKAGVGLVRKNPGYARQVVWPWLRGYFTWRLFFAILFFFLLTVVTYQKLTFDPYAELGLETNAELSKVKKAYRQLSMKYHPDKDASDEARIIYKKVRRAYKALTNPEKWEEEENQEQSVGVALPSIMTDPETRVYMMTIMIGALMMLPIWMLSKLMGKREQAWTPWVSLKKIAKYNQMAQSFYIKMGQPDCFELRYEQEERVRLVKLVAELDRKMPGGGLFRDPEDFWDRSELTVKDIVEHFCPAEVSSRVELRQLFLDACPQGESPKSPGAQGKGKGKTRQQDAMQTLTHMLWVDHEIIPHVADYFRTRAPHPTEKEVREAELYRRCVRGHNEDLKLEDPELCNSNFEAPTEDEVSAAQYHLFWVLNEMQFEIARLPREPNRRWLLDKLPICHRDKLSELESVRRQAAEEGKKSEQVGLSAAMRRVLVRVLNKDTASMKMMHEVVDDIKQMTRRRHKQVMQERQRMEAEWRRNQAQLMKKRGKGF
eukprot:Hpha_TRINITY_DN15295_c3_g10::TRINITY_DN15295_c3_g10_i1::g.68470::m.68470/K09540/SEC63, DNAJC23; translocation protein SEC63